jgi:3-hydroxyacyl-[acyl-carrier-protein] dehydratase
VEPVKIICGAYSGAEMILPDGIVTGVTAEHLTAQVRFSAEHVGFQGHFPDNPLLPGFLHIECVLDVLRHQLGSVDLVAIQSAKFLQPIRPEQVIDVTLEIQSKTVIAAELQVGGVVASRLVLEVSGITGAVAQKS